ncbi:epoxide hydrolase family protein [Chryseobacterium arthrosphaerae]|uniref:epoxide hydrolase family protein n=1 Tax=Chryseobacterium arthrosphaerae TaxID=651561 RepID=UPI001F4AE311|nr:epoxide hydrolase family protein [Chryseobacterium arthrosphaerae]
MKPFIVNIPEEVITDLKNRIANTRWPGEPEHSDWSYGTSEKYMKELADYWMNEYDWSLYEEQLNRFPQYTVEINGILIHFQYIKGKGPDPKPLILTHGWPDSYYRFHKIIPLLTEGEQSFDLIIPSIPGFGFSDKTAVSSTEVAAIWKKLMTEVLGYEKFCAAGGDIGMGVVKALASRYPDVVEAVHLTDVGYPTGQEDPATMSEDEKEFARFVQQWWYSQGAYAMVQSTKPQSIAYGLNDSPVGLAAWMISFVNAGTPPEMIETACGGKDEMLTNIMIYWVTQTIGSSARMYKADAEALWSGSQNPQKTDVPASVLVFPREAQFPKEWAERFVNVVSFKKMNEGGHFAALELPHIFADELRSFFYSIR